MIDFISTVDKKLFIFINIFLSNDIFDFIFPIITDKDNWIIPVMVAVFFLYKKEGPKVYYILALSLILVSVTDPICVRLLKPFFHRPRPCHPDIIIDGARYLIGTRSSFSFPSAHAMNVFAQATLLSFFYKSKRKYFMGLACAVGFSRVYVGVHYPLDILFGAFFGILSGIMLISMAKLIIPEKLNDLTGIGAHADDGGRRAGP